ncbi:MAG TPA: hypothetical protein VGI36_07475 [Candidatus Binataceae bacterium]
MDTTRGPAMHTTRTVDYIVLLKGDASQVLEQDEVRLKPFEWSCNEARITPGETTVTSRRYWRGC